MQKPQNISVLKSDPDLEPPTILFDSISIEFLSPLSRKLPRRAKHNSYPRIPIHRVLTEPELRNISPRNSSRIPLIRWSRSRVSIGIVHRWFISMLGARAPATQDRRFSPLPSPSPRGRDTAAYFHRYAIPVNPLPDFRPNVVRNDTTKLLLRLSSVVSSYARVASPLYPLLAMYIRAPTTRKAGSTQDGQ